MVCNSKSNVLNVNFNTRGVSKHETDKVNILQREKQAKETQSGRTWGKVFKLPVAAFEK